MFLKEHYILALIFVLLLTIILFGLAKAVFGMCYGENQKDKTSNTIKLPITMYIPQILLLITAFILGLYIPWNLTELVQLTIFGM